MTDTTYAVHTLESAPETAEALTIEKASPADAARAIVAGIIAGDEEIFPDKMSQGTGPAFFADPKGLERQVAGVPAVA